MSDWMDDEPDDFSGYRHATEIAEIESPRAGDASQTTSKSAAKPGYGGLDQD